jgi:hypothetical protein
MLVNKITHKQVTLKPGKEYSAGFLKQFDEYKTRNDHHEGGMFTIEARAHITKQ